MQSSLNEETWASIAMQRTQLSRSIIYNLISTYQVSSARLEAESSKYENLCHDRDSNPGPPDVASSVLAPTPL